MTRRSLGLALAVLLGVAPTFGPLDAPALADDAKTAPAKKPPTKPRGGGESPKPDRGDKDDEPPPAPPPKPSPEPPVRPGAEVPARPLPPSAVVPRQSPVARPTPETLRTVPYTRPHDQSHSAVERERLAPTPRPPAATRPYTPPSDRVTRPAHPASTDHRYARPHPDHLRPNREAGHEPPRLHAYRPWYTHWWVHPYYRHYHVTWVVVDLSFQPFCWATWWVPPARPGWVWIPGYWSWGQWIPGHWRPANPVPMHHGRAYVWVPGWWQGDLYLEGFWRLAENPRPGWVWVDGFYLEDGTYVRGDWRPVGPAPDGYVWEPGFFDGETWVSGFWRAETQPGYVWIAAWFDGDGVYHGGYWEPVRDQAGYVWIPGWFDGERWIDGYWVSEAQYRAAKPDAWAPEAGWNDGWDAPAEPPDEPPLAVPAD